MPAFFAELSMARIAREAGISKALLYHYFPSKQDVFVATLEEAAQELGRRTEPDPALPPARGAGHSLDAFLAWVDDNERGLPQADRERRQRPGGRRAGRPRSRDRTSARILEGSRRGRAPPPAARRGARAWLWFMDGAILDWVEHRDLDARRSCGGCCSGRSPGRSARRGRRGGRGSLHPAALLLLPDRRLGLDAVDDLAGAGERLAAVRRRGRHDHARLRQRHLPTRCSTAAAHRPWRATASATIAASRSSAISA